MHPAHHHGYCCDRVLPRDDDMFSSTVQYSLLPLRQSSSPYDTGRNDLYIHQDLQLISDAAQPAQLTQFYATHPVGVVRHTDSHTARTAANIYTTHPMWLYLSLTPKQLELQLIIGNVIGSAGQMISVNIYILFIITKRSSGALGPIL